MVTEICEIDREYVVAIDESGAGVRIQDDEDLDRLRISLRDGDEIVIRGEGGLEFEFGIDMCLDEVYKLLRTR